MNHTLDILYGGEPLEKADKALIMLHGRGADAESILSLAPHLKLPGFALLAPRASRNSWYPHSFMAPAATNEPWLTSALETVGRTLDIVQAAGIEPRNIYFLGFSQGACLTLEFTARHATRYGGIVAFTGGLIGEEIDRSPYRGDFAGTPIFLGSGDPDFHVPVERVTESAQILREMHADVTLKIYPGRGHTVSEEEIMLVNQLILP